MDNVNFKPKAFFIMQAYNTEKYIEEAILSILNQSEKDFLFVLRDNGSTDRTTDICKRYAEKDKRILFCRNEVNHVLTEDETIDYTNKINMCLDMESEYFAILDSDDFYHEDFLKITYDLAKKENADMVACGSNFIDEKGKKIISRRVPPNLIIKDKRLKEDDFTNLYGTLRPVWGKLYSSSIYKNYVDAFAKRPSDLINGGDTYAILTLMCQINIFVSTNIVLHSYRIRDNSIYHSFLPKYRVKSGYILFEKGIEFASAYDTLSLNVKAFLYNVYLNHIYDIVSALTKSDKMSVDDKLDYMMLIMNEKLFFEICESNNDFKNIIYNAVKKILDSASPKCKIQAWKYYIVRYYYYRIEASDNREMDALLLSVYCDKLNICGWGREKWRGVKKENFNQLICTVNSEILPKHQAAKDEMLTAMDNGDWNTAIQRLNFLSEEIPLGIDVLYFQIYLFYKFGDLENAARVSSVANVFYENDEDIKNITDLVYKEIELENNVGGNDNA